MRTAGALVCAAAVLLGASAASALQARSSAALERSDDACKVGPWGDWSECSKACDVGESFRTREVTRDGEDCPHLREVRLCNEHPCPMDCVVSDWSAWSKCSANCDKGTQARSRKVLSPARYGGKCPVLQEARDCNQQSCGHVEHGIAAIPTWKRDIKCARVDFETPFATEPLVFVTVNHRMAAAVQTHGAASAWVEGTTTRSFRVCVGGSDATDDMQLDWIASDAAPSMAVFLCDTARVQGGLLRLPPPAQEQATCATVAFPRAFAAGVAQVWASATLDPAFRAPGQSAAAAAREQRGANHALRTWLEDVSDAGFRVCAQGAAGAISPPDPRASTAGAGVRIAWTSFAGEGQDDSRTAPSCGNDRHQQGRVAFSRWGGGVKCHVHEFAAPFDAPPLVKATVARGATRAFFPSEPVLGWVEDVTAESFRACVYQAGPAGARSSYYMNFLATPNDRDAVKVQAGRDDTPVPQLE